MNTTQQQATADVLDYLAILHEEQVRPDEARRRFRAIQAQHPDVTMELVWEEEAYDRSVHYDALVYAQDGATVSVSFCRDGALPWPLRGVHRWSDADLMQVNGNILKIQEAMGLLDDAWSRVPITRQLVNVCLIREEVERHPIELSDAELQLGMDRWRRANRLHDAAATRRWLQERGMTHEQLEQSVLAQLTMARLRERLTAGRIEPYFAAHHADFDTVRVAQLGFLDELQARRAHGEILSGQADFFEAAQRQFMVGPPSERPLFAALRRRDLSADLGAAIFAAAPERVSLLSTEGVHLIIQVLSVTPAHLDQPTRAAVEEVLFEEWLAERRQAADVTWFWGTADRTS